MTNVTATGAFTLNSGSVAGDLNIGTGGDVRSGATAILTGNGYWFDYNAGNPRFRVGQVSAGVLTNGLYWNGSALTVTNANAISATALTAQSDTAAVSTDGLTLATTSVGDAGHLESRSPRIRFFSTYYKVATLSDVSNEFIEEAIPTSSAGASKLTWSYRFSTGSYAPIATLSESGNFAVTGLLAAGSGPTTLTNAAGKVLGAALVGTDIATVGTITAGTWSASFGAVSGANLTNITAANVTGSHALSDGVLSTNVALLNTGGTFTADVSVSYANNGDSVGSYFKNTGSGAGTLSRLSVGQTNAEAIALLVQFDHPSGTATIINRKATTGTLELQTTGGGITVQNSGGVVIGSPTGGDKGSGSINAVTVWRNGTSLDSVFEPDYRLLSIDEMGEFIRLNHHLPTIPTSEVNQKGSTNLGALEDRLWETTENHALYIIQLSNEIKTLKATVADLEKQRYQPR
jgi:hypothetical protein